MEVDADLEADEAHTEVYEAQKMQTHGELEGFCSGSL